MPHFPPERRLRRPQRLLHRLQAGGNVGRVQPAFKESHTEQQTPSPPNFLLPLLGGLAFALFNRAQSAVAEVEVRKSVMSRIVGPHRSEARRHTAYRLYQDVRRALATGTDEDTLGLATALTLFALDTAAEVGRIKISATPSDDSAAWLGAVLPHLESHRPAFRGVITALVAAERAAVSPGQPAAATAPGAAPPLDTRVDPLARLANMNRSPAYDPAGLGWNHPSSRTTNNWTGVGLEPCPVSPFAHQLPLPDAGGKESAKRSCPGKEPKNPRILGDQCPSCASKKTPGGCVARYSLAESGPASQQCQLSLLETPSLALLWNLSGLPKQDGDEDDRGLPSYLEGADPPGWPLPDGRVGVRYGTGATRDTSSPKCDAARPCVGRRDPDTAPAFCREQGASGGRPSLRCRRRPSVHTTRCGRPARRW